MREIFFPVPGGIAAKPRRVSNICLLYTSDAADEL